MKRCSVRFLCRSKCLKFPTKSQSDLNYHVAKQNSAQKPDVIFKCKLCYQEFPGYYALGQHNNIQHGFTIGTANVHHDDINKVDDMNLRKELHSCQHFCVDSDNERATHKILNYAIEKLNATKVDEKFDRLFKKLNCAAKNNPACRFLFKTKKKRWIQIFLRPGKQYPAGSIQTFVHQGRLGKAKKFFKRNWRHRAL